jgi:hypothetical protein
MPAPGITCRGSTRFIWVGGTAANACVEFMRAGCDDRFLIRLPALFPNAILRMSATRHSPLNRMPRIIIPGR